MYKYSLYNLNIESEFKIPFIEIFDKQKDKRYSFGENKINLKLVKSELKEFTDLEFIGNKNNGYLRCYNISDSILICSGRSIRIRIYKTENKIEVDCDEVELSEAMLICCGIGTSCVLLYRGIISLHAAGVGVEKKNIGIMADSGTGKSTFLWYLLNKSNTYISDDVLPVSIESELINVIPSVSLPMKLWGDTISDNYIEVEDSIEMIEGLGKYWIKVSGFEREIDKVPLNALFLLNPTDYSNNDEIEVRKLEKNEAIMCLINNTHAIWCLPFEQQGKLLPLYASLAIKVPLYEIRYKRHVQVLPYLMEKIRLTLS